MRIEPTGVNPPSPQPVEAQPRAGAKPPGPPAVAGQSFSVSSDLAALLAAVRDVPDVRTDAVAGASAQVADGSLDTPAAAADAARALLDSGDLTAPQ
jgi:hypothetical protein